MEMTYKVLLHEADYRAIYENMRQDGTLWTAWPDIDPDEWTPEIVVRLMSRPDVLVLGGAVDGVPAGFMTLQAVSRRSMTAEIGVAAFRPFFRQAAALCRGALLWACDNLELSSFLGKVAAPNRHVLAMLGRWGSGSLGGCRDCSGTHANSGSWTVCWLWRHRRALERSVQRRHDHGVWWRIFYS